MSGAGSTTIQINGNQRDPEASATLVQRALMGSTTMGSMMWARRWPKQLRTSQAWILQICICNSGYISQMQSG